MKKIQNPDWAPPNIGAILKQLRIACNVKGFYDESLGGDWLGNLIIGPQEVRKIENGNRGIRLKELENYINSLILVAGEKPMEIMKNDQSLREMIPNELKSIIMELTDEWKKNNR